MQEDKYDTAGELIAQNKKGSKALMCEGVFDSKSMIDVYILCLVTK